MSSNTIFGWEIEIFFYFEISDLKMDKYSSLILKKCLVILYLDGIFKFSFILKIDKYTSLFVLHIHIQDNIQVLIENIKKMSCDISLIYL